MPYNRESFDTLKARIAADFNGLAAVLQNAFAVVWAKTVHGMLDYLAWIDAQNSPLTCELERLPDWAALYAVDRLNATAAFGNIEVTGNLGAIVVKDAIYRGDNGLDYSVTTAITLDVGINLVPIKCLSTGVAGNLIAGQKLNLVNPLLGVNSEALVDANAIGGGEVVEDVEAWRVRVVDEWQTVVRSGPRSGKSIDYKAWASTAHPSVTTALVQLHTLGYGTVLVRPICNSLPNRQPSQSVIEAVEQSLLLLAPGTAYWTVAAPNLNAVNVIIDLDNTVDTQQNRDAITLAITTLIDRELLENAELKTAELDAAIASVTTQYTLVEPTADVTAASGEIFVLNNLGWV